MKCILSLLLISLGCFGKAGAQKHLGSAYLTSYSHTINYPYGKAVFYLCDLDGNSKKTDPNKFYYWYGGNQITKTQGGSSGRLLDGIYKEFYSNKNLRQEGQFEKGLKTAIWKTWTEDGILTSYMKYHSGTLNGKFQKFNDAGKLIEAGRYRNGRLTGNLERYDNSDSVRLESYKNGQIIKHGQSWLTKKWKQYFSKKTVAKTNSLN